MTVAQWLALAKANAEQRGLPDLVPALEGLSKATAQLRAADWNDAADRPPRSPSPDDDTDGQGGHP